MSQRSMRYHEGDTTTTITREIIIKTTIKVKMITMEGGLEQEHQGFIPKEG